MNFVKAIGILTGLPDDRKNFFSLSNDILFIFLFRIFLFNLSKTKNNRKI